MANNQETKELIAEMQKVLDAAVEMAEENRELKIKLAKLEESDEDLERDMHDFRNKLQYFTSKRDETSIEHKVKELEQNENNINN